jgi:hypothetical protein
LTTNSNPGRTPRASTQTPPTTPKARVRKRDRIRTAAKGKTFGMSTMGLIATAAIGVLGYVGFRKVDADRLKADPNARPLADEIVDRATTATSTARDKVQDVAGAVAAKTSATVHDLGEAAASLKDDVAARAGIGSGDEKSDAA